jgi:hypothetical protein
MDENENEQRARREMLLRIQEEENEEEEHRNTFLRIAPIAKSIYDLLYKLPHQQAWCRTLRDALGLNAHVDQHGKIKLTGPPKEIAVMTRHDTLSRRPAKEQPPADMRDDKTANTIADQTHIPLPSLTPSIPCPASDRCATAVPVGASRRSVPAIRRFCPVLGWRTMLQHLACRAAESDAFSLPDRNAL